MYCPFDETKNFGVIILMDDAAKTSFAKFHANPVKSSLYSTVPGFCGEITDPMEYPNSTVISAFQDENALLQAQRFLRMHHRKVRKIGHTFCITLKKHDNTVVADRLLDIFDKVFFVDSEPLLFFPVDIIEAWSENCFAGIDFADVCSMIAYSKKIYLATSSHADLDSFVKACGALQPTINACSKGRRFNLVMLLHVPQSCGLDDIESAISATDDSLPDLDDLVFIPRFNSKDDTDFHLAVLICPHDI